MYIHISTTSSCDLPAHQRHLPHTHRAHNQRTICSKRQQFWPADRQGERNKPLLRFRHMVAAAIFGGWRWCARWFPRLLCLYPISAQIPVGESEEEHARTGREWTRVLQTAREWMRVCMRVSNDVHMCVCGAATHTTTVARQGMHKYMCVWMKAHTHMMYVSICIWMYACAYACLYDDDRAGENWCRRDCTWVVACVCVNIYVRIYLYLYLEVYL